jgi:hypothetical protein
MMRIRSLVPLFVALSVALGAAACSERNKVELNGIYPWVINKTTLEKWGYMNSCSPRGELLFCQASPLEEFHTRSLGGQDALVDAYFKGSEPSALLVELVLSVPGCKAEALQGWMRERFGKPSEDKGKVAHWSGREVFISAKLGASCQIFFVAADDASRIDELKGGKK